MAAIDEQRQQILSGVGSLQELVTRRLVLLFSAPRPQGPVRERSSNADAGTEARAGRTVLTAPTGGGMHDAAAGIADVWCHNRAMLSRLTGVSAASGVERCGGPVRDLIPLLCICMYVHTYY